MYVPTSLAETQPKAYSRKQKTHGLAGGFALGPALASHDKARQVAGGLGWGEWGCSSYQTTTFRMSGLPRSD